MKKLTCLFLSLLFTNHSIAEKNTSYSLSYLFNGKITRIKDISTLEFLYAYKSEYYRPSIMISHSTLKLTSIISSPLAVENTEVASLVRLGFGATHPTQFTHYFIKSKNFVEITSAYFTFHFMKRSFSQMKFMGLGLKIDLGLCKKITKNFSIGGKVSYNIVSLKRALLEEESVDTLRSMLGHWLSLGLNLTYNL